MFNKALRFLFICMCIISLSGCELDSDSKEEDSYKISGSIQLLDGEIELSLNNEEFLTVSGFTTKEFIFNKELTNTASYSISITQHPESQRCTLYNGDGSINEHDIINVKVTCKSFYQGTGGVSEVSVGGHHACMIKDEEVSCWGDNRFGQLNIPSNLQSPRLISTGSGQSCVLDDTGVVCWGMENLGISMTAPPESLQNVTELKAGFGAACAIDENGLLCWGETQYVTNFPVNLDNPHGLVVKGSNACVIDGKKPVCWGSNTKAITLPNDLLEVENIDVGLAHGCAITSGLVRCWGDNWGYKNGNGPIDVPNDLGPARHIALGAINSCVITDTETRCWGSTEFGLDDIQEIGIIPRTLDIERFHGCAIENYKLTCFGSNGEGESDFTKKIF